jgi:hypothetical protein
MINKIIWSDSTKIYTKTECIMLWGCFSVAGTGRLVRIERKMTGTSAKILDENLLQRSQDWGEGSPSNRTVTQSTQPRQCKSGFGTSGFGTN